MGLTIRECAAGSETLLALWHDFLNGRMASALLLIGESGVGKRTFARLLAQALLCSGTENAEQKPCGACRGCKRFLSRTHPDALFPAPLPKENSEKQTIRTPAFRPKRNSAQPSAATGIRRNVSSSTKTGGWFI